MNDIRRICNMAFVTIALMGLVTIGATAVRASGTGEATEQGDGVKTEEAAPAQQGISDKSAAYLAIALTMGVACMSAAYAVGKVGAAALGAAAEKPELLNKALPFVGLGEGIAVLGMLISFLLWMKL